MSDSDKEGINSTQRRPLRLSRIALWALAVGLLWWAGRDIEIAAIIKAIGRLSILQISILTAVNLTVLLTLSGRWWVVLRGLGFPVNYLHLSAYRLAAFGLSYFTPGPQFGGEPLQIYLLKARHEIPITSGTASVTLEKVIELLGNFTFLLIGLALIARLEFFQGHAGSGLIIAAVLLLVLPLAALWVIARGLRPISTLMGRTPAFIQERLTSWSRWQSGVLAVEVEMSVLFREKPMYMLAAMAFSLLTWVMLVLEYGLMLSFLDLSLSLEQTIAVLTTARLAFLTPLPGGLGALEAGQAFAFQRLGFSVAEGLSVGLLIRARDVIFGAVGLLLGSLLADRATQPEL